MFPPHPVFRTWLILSNRPAGRLTRDAEIHTHAEAAICALRRSISGLSAHGRNNSVSAAEFPVTWGPDEKLACRNGKIPVRGFRSANCSQLPQSSFHATEFRRMFSQQQRYNFLASSSSGFPRSVNRTETFFRRARLFYLTLK